MANRHGSPKTSKRIVLLGVTVLLYIMGIVGVVVWSRSLGAVVVEPMVAVRVEDHVADHAMLEEMDMEDDEEDENETDREHYMQHLDAMLKQDELEHWGRLYSPTRILCAVPTVWPDHKHRIRRISETWGPYCDKLLWVMSRNGSFPEDDEIHVGSLLLLDLKRYASATRLTLYREPDEKTKNIWDKSHRMWEAIEAQYVHDYEWFLKVDDDSFFMTENFRRFAQFYAPYIPHYLGNTILYRWKYSNIVFNSGIAYALSRAALERVAPVLRNMPTDDYAQWHSPLCVDRPGSSEDAAMGICLRSIGINPDNTVDDQGRERFLPMHIKSHKHMIRSKFWYWKYRSPKVQEGKDCCVDDVIVTHFYKTDSAKVDQSYKLLYETFYSKEQMQRRLEDAPVPPKPKLFLYDPDLPFDIDEYRNDVKRPKAAPVFTGYHLNDEPNSHDSQ